MVAKPFHIIGFDIMLDEDRKAWLIEINNNPSLNINFEQGFMDSKSSEPSPIDA
jgi:tubulin polyglutamylase TTLL11